MMCYHHRSGNVNHTYFVCIVYYNDYMSRFPQETFMSKHYYFILEVAKFKKMSERSKWAVIIFKVCAKVMVGFVACLS